MHQIKITNFHRDNPKQEFPNYTSLNCNQIQDVKKQLCIRLVLDKNSTPKDMLQKIHNCMIPCKGIKADEEDFNLLKLMEDLGIHSLPEVYINWSFFDDIDKIQLEDVAKYFDYIWYTGSDEIEMFDQSFSWIISIDGDSYVSYCRF